MKTKDQLYERESVMLRPRVLKANSQSGSQDLPVQEASSSRESEQDAESYGETRSSTADYRVPGISISTVKLQDARPQNNVTKIIETFEKHQHKEHFLEDMSEKQEINKFSEESQQLLEDMNQTEIFELCKNSAKNFTVLKYKRSPTTTEKDNCDFTSIPGFVIKKNSSRGPKHGASERQIMFFKAKEMLKERETAKARRPSNDSRKEVSESNQHSNEESILGCSVTVQLVWLYFRVFQERCDRKA